MPLPVALCAIAVYSFGSITETLGLDLDTFCLSNIYFHQEVTVFSAA